MEFLPMSSRSVLVWSLRYIIISLPALFLLTLVLSFSPFVVRMVFGLFLFATIFLLLVLFPFRYRRFRYQIGQDSIVVLSGVFFRYESVMKMEQVKYITVYTTPIEAMLGLRSIWVKGAGAKLSIPMLPKADAEKIRRQLLGLE